MKLKDVALHLWWEYIFMRIIWVIYLQWLPLQHLDLNARGRTKEEGRGLSPNSWCLEDTSAQSKYSPLWSPANKQTHQQQHEFQEKSQPQAATGKIKKLYERDDSRAALCLCWKQELCGHSCCPNGRCLAGTWWLLAAAGVQPSNKPPTDHRGERSRCSSCAPDTSVRLCRTSVPTLGLTDWAGRGGDHIAPGVKESKCKKQLCFWQIISFSEVILQFCLD